MKELLKLSRLLGLNGESLKKLTKLEGEYSALEEIRDIALGAFSSRYPDERIRKERLEQYQDLINGLKRDILCDYILAKEKELKFKTKSDLFAFFLLDVEMGPCFRTSRVLAGISSLQLYVHRVLINLEQSVDGKINVLKSLSDPTYHDNSEINDTLMEDAPYQLNGVVLDEEENPLIGVTVLIAGSSSGAVTDLDGNFSIKIEDPNSIIVISYTGYPTKRIPINGQSFLRIRMGGEEDDSKERTYLPDIIKQWEWRKYYRIWEANRKVFLYPENYIEPDLRDNKSHLFTELEDELLQEEISLPAAEAAYAKYISKFSDLTKLKIAGSYYHGRTQEENGDFYFFARTRTKPFEYYYRVYKASLRTWGKWVKINLTIDAPEVSAMIRYGRLHIFWNVIEHSQNLSSNPISHKFKVFINYSYEAPNNQWSNPQKVFLGYTNLNEDQINPIISRPNIDDGNRESKINEYIDLAFSKPYPIIEDENYDQIKIFSLLSVKLPNDRRGEYLRINASYGEDRFQIYSEGKPLSALNFGGKRIYSAPASISTINGGLIFFPNKNLSTEYININELPHVIENVGAMISAEESLITIHSGNWRTINGKKLKYRQEIYANIPYFTAEGSLVINDPGLVELIIEEVPVQFKWYTWITNAGIADKKTRAYYLPEPLISYQTVKVKIYTRVNLELVKEDYESSKYFESTLNFFSNTERSKYGINFSNNLPLTSNKRFLKENAAISQKSESFIQNGYSNFYKLKYKIITSEDSYNSQFVKTELGRPIPFDLSGISLESFIPKRLEKLSDNFLNLVVQTGFDKKGKKFDFKEGVNSGYYREMFFHIPFLIANNLNGIQKFKEAKWWYERIFDPTTPDSSDSEDSSVRYWKYLEFKENDPRPSIRSILLGEGTHEEAAINVYLNDPFNPHAIARLRLSAYQKSIVMKYIDNLLDWGDYLFTQDTMESINEATMLYVLAADILGNRPVQLGKCDAVKEEQLTYEKVKENMKGEFLSFFENKVFQYEGVQQNKEFYGSEYLVNNSVFGHITNDRIHSKELKDPKDQNTEFTQSIVNELLVFCIPNNKIMLEYWDRVEDRLYKIRNCMNIRGIRRQLALFQPPIDPRLLVRARAAGLTEEEAINLALSLGPEIPYRFSILLEKARQFIQTVQSFGNALLSALEKKDNEELILLRSIHEQSILDLSKKIRDSQIKETESQYQALIATKENTQFRKEYYSQLVDEGKSGWEIAQQITKHAANYIMPNATFLLALSSGLHSIPKIMGMSNSTGGDESAKNAEMGGENLKYIADILHSVSDSMALEASFHRREQDWTFQRDLADKELIQVERQILGAEIRKSIAEKEKEIHDKNIEQSEELYQFYGSKFTNLGLYNFLSTQLQRLYRKSYNQALALAKAAETAYQFELDDQTYFIKNDNWYSQKTGLLAGERLLLQLQQMEYEYLQKNTRLIEITQSFSMRQIAPEKLIALKVDSRCENFTIPEIAYDLIYPGYYKRLIKSVRITIPCIVGPYTNIGCTVSLNNAMVRSKPNTTDDENLIRRMPSGNTIIATSNGQNDGGQFELNFRDERFLPFEGAGAISTWSLELPSVVRSFDYNSISDVIFHISYTAKFDGGIFKNDVTERLMDSLNRLNGRTMERLFSLRHDFSSDWHRFTKRMEDGPFKAEIRKDFFPYWAQGIDLSLRSVKLFGIGLKDQLSEETTENPFDNTILGGNNFRATLTIPREVLQPVNESVKDWFLLISYELRNNS